MVAAFGGGNSASGYGAARPAFGTVSVRPLRAACTPMNLILGAVVALGWFALVGWTGAGPDGWQARLCAGLESQPRACAALSGTGEARRTATARPAGVAS